MSLYKHPASLAGLDTHDHLEETPGKVLWLSESPYQENGPLLPQTEPERMCLKVGSPHSSVSAHCYTSTEQGVNAHPLCIPSAQATQKEAAYPSSPKVTVGPVAIWPASLFKLTQEQPPQSRPSKAHCEKGYACVHVCARVSAFVSVTEISCHQT